MQTLSHFPGQTVTIYLETKDGYGVRTDSVSLPFVSKIVFPSITLAAGYPQDMIWLDTGLYYYQFTLPTGASSVGSYFVDVVYVNPADSLSLNESYQVIVNAPYGNFSSTIG